MTKFLDVCIQPVSKKHLALYKKGTTKMGQILLKHGALASYDYVADDESSLKSSSAFVKATKTKKNEILIVAVAEFKSKSHRDQVFKKMMKDPEMNQMMNESAPYIDHKRMLSGGFKKLVHLKKS